MLVLLLLYTFISIILIIVLSSNSIEKIKIYSYINSLIILFLSCVLWLRFDYNFIGYQEQYNLKVSLLNFNINYHIGIDGISLFYVILTVFLFYYLFFLLYFRYHCIFILFFYLIIGIGLLEHVSRIFVPFRSYTLKARFNVQMDLSKHKGPDLVAFKVRRSGIVFEQVTDRNKIKELQDAYNNKDNPKIPHMEYLVESSSNKQITGGFVLTRTNSVSGDTSSVHHLHETGIYGNVMDSKEQKVDVPVKYTAPTDVFSDTVKLSDAIKVQKAETALNGFLKEKALVIAREDSRLVIFVPIYSRDYFLLKGCLRKGTPLSNVYLESVNGIDTTFDSQD